MFTKNTIILCAVAGLAQAAADLKAKSKLARDLDTNPLLQDLAVMPDCGLNCIDYSTWLVGYDSADLDSICADFETGSGDQLNWYDTFVSCISGSCDTSDDVDVSYALMDQFCVDAANPSNSAAVVELESVLNSQLSTFSPTSTSFSHVSTSLSIAPTVISKSGASKAVQITSAIVTQITITATQVPSATKKNGGNSQGTAAATSSSKAAAGKLEVGFVGGLVLAALL